jgi:hypothetical protein
MPADGCPFAQPTSVGGLAALESMARPARIRYGAARDAAACEGQCRSSCERPRRRSCFRQLRLEALHARFKSRQPPEFWSHFERQQRRLRARSQARALTCQRWNRSCRRHRHLHWELPAGVEAAVGSASTYRRGTRSQRARRLAIRPSRICAAAAASSLHQHPDGGWPRARRSRWRSDLIWRSDLRCGGAHGPANGDEPRSSASAGCCKGTDGSFTFTAVGPSPSWHSARDGAGHRLCGGRGSQTASLGAHLSEDETLSSSGTTSAREPCRAQE